MIFLKKTNIKRSVYVNTILSFFFWNGSIGIFMRYPCLKIMSVFHITLTVSLRNYYFLEKF